MRFTKVENGIVKRENFKLKNYFKEFMAMNVKTAKIELDKDDYKSVIVGYKVLYNAAKRHGVPIKVSMHEGNIYFIRTDI